MRRAPTRWDFRNGARVGSRGLLEAYWFRASQRFGQHGGERRPSRGAWRQVATQAGRSRPPGLPLGLSQLHEGRPPGEELCMSGRLWLEAGADGGGRAGVTAA